VVRGDLVDREPAPLWEDVHVPALEVPREPERSQPASPAIDTKQQLLARLEEVPDASVPELAKSLERSASTVLRALRDLVDERRVERKGFARATRYQLR
jgi:predicted HTH transcriptional regulator